MKSQDIKQNIAKFPDSPGVYFFRFKKNILYIGKATSLKSRVRSYFRDDIVNTRGPLISKMLSEFDDISFQKTDSVLEALILEAYLIKKYQPPANTMFKDDRSFNYVVITEEDFPRVLVVRGKELEVSRTVLAMNSKMAKTVFDTPIAEKFGPFTNGSQLKEAMKIVRRLFPYRDKCIPCELHRGTLCNENSIEKYDVINKKQLHRGTLCSYCKPCFNRQIGLCPGVCTGEISKKDYAKIIKNIVLFFEGNKKMVVKNLEKEMKQLAKEKKFEQAGIIKRKIFALGHIQDVSLIQTDIREEEMARGTLATNFRIESYDIAHMSGKNVVGVMTVVENGEVKKSDYRKFEIKENLQLSQGYVGQAGNNDIKSLSEVLSRRLMHIEWTMPDLIVVDGGVAQRNVMQKILKQNDADIPVVSVVKDEHHRPKEILGDKKWLKYEKEIILSNSEAHRFAISFHKKLREKLPN